MKLLIDTNVILDYLLVRPGFREDAVQYSVALANRVDIIITRNHKDFEGGPIPVLSPKEFLDSIA